jgi:nicotinamidase-related amidase
LINRKDKPMSSEPSSSTEPGGHRDTALVIVDMISCWDFPDAEHLLPGAAAITPRIAALKRRCHQEGVPVIYTNDNRGQWKSDFSSLVDLSLKCGGEVAAITQALSPDENDYFVLKPKQSAFFGTPLELLLQHLRVTRLIVTGVASDQCVLTTAVEARMRDLSVVVPKDCIASQSESRNQAVLLQLEQAHKMPTTVGSRIRLSQSTDRQANTASTLVPRHH